MFYIKIILMFRKTFENALLAASSSNSSKYFNAKICVFSAKKKEKELHF